MSTDTENDTSGMHKVLTQYAFHAFEDGSTAQEPVTCFYDAVREDFVVFLPAYMRGICEATTARGKSPVAATLSYEANCEHYSRTTLFAKSGVRKLAVPLRALPSDAARANYGISAQVAMGMCTVAVLPSSDDDDVSLIQVDDDGKLGKAFNTEQEMVLIDDTPEHRAKLQALIDSINTAAQQLMELCNDASPAAYLAAIHWGPQSGPTETPVAVATALEDDETP